MTYFLLNIVKKDLLAGFVNLAPVRRTVGYFTDLGGQKSILKSGRM